MQHRAGKQTKTAPSGSGSEAVMRSDEKPWNEEQCRKQRQTDGKRPEPESVTIPESFRMRLSRRLRIHLRLAAQRSQRKLVTAAVQVQLAVPDTAKNPVMMRPVLHNRTYRSSDIRCARLRGDGGNRNQYAHLLSWEIKQVARLSTYSMAALRCMPVYLPPS